MPDVNATPTPQANLNSTEQLKQTIAANLSELRRSKNMTQLDLAEKLNYTDKAISKWERGESMPDITVLKVIADLFGVTVDYLLEETHEPLPAEVPAPAETAEKERNLRTRGFITGMSILMVWMVAIVLFMVFDILPMEPSAKGIVFLYAVPTSFVLWLILNSIWFNRRRNYLIISLLMWSVLVTVFCTVWFFADRLIWPVFMLGLPGQAIIIMWSRIKHGGGKA